MIIKKSRFGVSAKNLHELVSEYNRTFETLQSFVGHFKHGNDCDLKSIQNFSKLIDKYDNLGSQIMIQYKKEDPFVALYEMKRMMEPELGEKSVVEVVCEELGNH